MSQLMTDWICIATEGDTVDGRVMEPQWILEAAELYNPALYTARIWPEHERGFGAMGEVLAVKAERDDDGVLRLYAQLRPNHHCYRPIGRDNYCLPLLNLRLMAIFAEPAKLIWKGWQ